VEYTQKVLQNNPDDVSALIQLSRTYATGLADLRSATTFAERAVAAAARTRAKTPESNPESWRWVTSLEASARSNLAWIHQLAAHQNSILRSNIQRR
jgi:hypothetical protein